MFIMQISYAPQSKTIVYMRVCVCVRSSETIQ